MNSFEKHGENNKNDYGSNIEQNSEGTAKQDALIISNNDVVDILAAGSATLDNDETAQLSYHSHPLAKTIAASIGNINLSYGPSSDGRRVPILLEVFSKDLSAMASFLLDTETPTSHTEEVIQAMESLFTDVAKMNEECLIQKTGNEFDQEDYCSLLYGGDNLKIPPVLTQILSGQQQLTQEVSILFSHISPGEIDLPLYESGYNEIEHQGPDATDMLF